MKREKDTSKTTSSTRLQGRQDLQANLIAQSAVVPALLKRSFAGDWQERADSLSIVLKKEGFLAVLELAETIAHAVDLGDPAEQDRLFKEIAFQGYWYNRDPDGYSVVVVPVMWPDLPIGLTMAGAGDSVSALFAMMGRT